MPTARYTHYYILAERLLLLLKGRALAVQHFCAAAGVLIRRRQFVSLPDDRPLWFRYLGYCFLHHFNFCPAGGSH